MHGISLSRLAITGAISTNTPKVVIEEIADAHFIKYNEQSLINKTYLVNLISVINTRKVKIVKKPYSKEMLSTIARYVNSKYLHWRKESLIKSFNFLQQYTDINKLLEPHNSFNYGRQTPENIKSLNGCVLYGICKANRIITNFYTSLEEMAANIKLLFSIRNPEIHYSVKSRIFNNLIYEECNSYQLINLLYLLDSDQSKKILSLVDSKNPQNLNYETHVPEYSYEELQQTAEIVRHNQTKYTPKNNIEAVVMAAIFYKIDISEVTHPLIEYTELCRSYYFPYDKKFAARLKIGREHPENLTNPNLDQVFNPNLPSNLYDEKDLINLCEKEGIVIQNYEGPYSLLQGNFLLSTFLHGKQCDIINETNIYFEEITELEYDEIVVYGVRNYEVIAYTYAELNDTFTHHKRFRKPEINEMFEDEEVDKLFILTMKDQREGESTEMFRQRIELGETIERIRLLTQTTQEQIQNFIDVYENLEKDDKTRVDSVLLGILYSGMYMRGWKGEHESFPLSSESTIFGPDEQVNVDHRVTQSLIELDELFDSINDLDGLGDYMKKLPLIVYDMYNHIFYESTDESEGISIDDRIYIIRGGEDSTVQSCIRLSSNRFLATAYYYMKLIGMKTYFDISEMSHIS